MTDRQTDRQTKFMLRSVERGSFTLAPITSTSGMSPGCGIRLVMCDLCTLRNQGITADKVDAIREWQLRWTQTGSSS